MSTPIDQHVLAPRGPQAAQIAELWWFYLAIMVVVCLLVWGFVLVAAFRRHAKTIEPPKLDEETLSSVATPLQPASTLSNEAERGRLRWVLGATATTIAVLFVLLVESVETSQLLAQLTGEALQIELVGHRWWWGARYLDAKDPSQIFATANELHIPVGVPVELTLSSADVIHSFWVPNLHGKRDLVPGHRTKLRLQADMVGTYRGQCAEFCGPAHAQMALLVIAEPKQKFEAWRAAQREPASAPTNDEARRGRDVFMAGPCVMCHAIAGTSAQSGVGPDLTHVASRSLLAAGSLPNTRGHLGGWLANAPNLKPGTTMPSISLPAADLHALIAYLEGLR